MRVLNLTALAAIGLVAAFTGSPASAQSWTGGGGGGYWAGNGSGGVTFQSNGGPAYGGPYGGNTRYYGGSVYSPYGQQWSGRGGYGQAQTPRYYGYRGVYGGQQGSGGYPRGPMVGHGPGVGHGPMIGHGGPRHFGGYGHFRPR